MWRQRDVTSVLQADDLQALVGDLGGAVALGADPMYPAGVALALWFTQHGRVDTAYVYEVIRPHSKAHPREQIVLGLDEPPNLELSGY